MILLILWSIIAYVITAILWYLSLNLLLKESSKWVFFRLEYFIYSFLVGVIIIGWILSVYGIIGIPLSFFPLSIGIIIIAWSLLYYNKKNKTLPEYRSLEWAKKSSYAKIFVFIGTFLLLIKLWIGAVDITAIPTYQDDTFVNWNLRAKIFYERESLVLDKNDTEFLWSGYRQYPMTASLYKTYIAIFSWWWHEGSANLPSFIFFIAVLGSIYFLIFRITKEILFSWLGVYMLISIPLYFIHGTSPYMDVFQSLYFLSAACFVFLFLRWEISWLPVAFMIGLLWYTKSEWLIIFTTAILAALFIMQWFQKNHKKEGVNFLKILIVVIWINLPFILFKLYFDLGFGNGNASVSSTEVTLHTEIFYPLYRALFHGGSYNVFFFFFCILGVVFLLKKWVPQTYRSSELFFVLAGFIAFFIIIFIYLTTFTYQYVLDQTGINRSMMQIVPILVLQFIIFLHFLRHAR